MIWNMPWAYGRQAPAAPAAPGGSGGLATFAFGLGLIGAGNSAIGAYYGAMNDKAGLKSQALSAEYEAQVENHNARNAERDAQAVLRAAEREAGTMTLRYGQEKGARRAALAARGVDAGTGSAAEELASTELAKQQDVLTFNANAVRAAEASRMRGVDASNRAMLLRTSARNLRGTARSIKPGVGAASSLLTSAGQVAGGYAMLQRY